MKTYKSVITLIGILFFSIASNPEIYAQSKAKAKTVQPEAGEVLQRARKAFLEYDFDTASDLYDDYRNIREKAKQPVSQDLEIWEKELEVASNAFDRVQKIEVIDTIMMPAETFFEAYRLAQSSGKIGPSESLISSLKTGSEEMGYINETEDYAIIPIVGEAGELRLTENILLLDGTWETHEALAGDFDKSGDYAYPFMMGDGQTLYFANNGEESMGGYDIFVAQREPITGEYLQPLNIGMPFNSPYDDYMLAIDEENGIGWWATNRDSNGEFVTIFVYLVDDTRVNYPSDTDDLEKLAKITDYRLTQEEGREEIYKVKLASIPQKKEEKPKKKEEFELFLGNGVVYHNFSDFRNVKAAESMRAYLKNLNALAKAESSLQKMRERVSKGGIDKSEILRKEQEIEKLREDSSTLKKEVIKLEKCKR